MPKGEKCIVYGCQNHKGEGGFVGDICRPCYEIITKGRGSPTAAFLGQCRQQVDETVVGRVLVELTRELREDITKKGTGAFATMAETRGTIDEEVEEMHEAVHANDTAALREKLTDIAVAAIWGLASLEVW